MPPQTSASPSPAPTDASVLGGDVQAVAPTGSGSGSGSLYGLGAWKDQTIDVQGFPAQIVSALSKAGVDTSKPVNAEDLAKALASIHDVNAVAQLQQMLFYSGFYSNGTSLADLQLGRFGDKDVAALANSIRSAGQTSSQLGAYLTTSANTGYAQGKINQAAGVGVTPIKQISPLDEDAALRTAAHNLLGREPSAQDLAGFRAYYDQAYTAGQKAVVALQQKDTTAGLPDAATLGGAMGRQGLGFSDAAEAPPAMLHDAPAPSQARNPDFSGPNPALPLYRQQRQQDLGVLGQVNSVGTANSAPPTLTDAPNVGTAAEQYLRDHEAGAIGQQDVLSKYADILKSFIGNGE